MGEKKELSYSLHLSNDKNKSKKARRSANNTQTGTTSLSNNAIQNSQQLSKVDKHNLRKYDEEQELICTIKGTSSLVEDTKNLYLDLFEDARIKYNEKQTRNDRKIENYFNHISNDNKRDLACEIIIELGDMDFWADKEKSMGINIINNNADDVYINIDCDSGYIVVTANNLKTEKEISKDSIKINTIGSATIKEITCNINLEDENNIKKLKIKVNNKIKDIIKDGYMFARDNGSDIFGLGLTLYRNHPLYYKNIDWYDNYLKIEPEINVDINIENNGTLKNTMRLANE